MNRLFTLASLILMSMTLNAQQPVAIAIHGGAGTIERGKLSEEQETAIRAALDEAIDAGHRILQNGGSSLDAVVAAVKVLEDAPQFNAGRGAVLTHEGKVELDASIMNGADLNAGAVASVTGIRHPIEAARAVMTQSPHVMLVSEGANAFAEAIGLEFKEPDWFITDFRARQLESVRDASQASTQLSEDWFSTVGAVALDANGNLAAATSTGGMTNKRWGRVGDSPIIGAGTYADNASCAVSATGHGEYFIRHVVAYDICARMRYSELSLAESADAVVHGVLAEAGGDGGVIAIDGQGNIAMPFNTQGMYRASVDANGVKTVAIYGDD
ncbi:MAG: isoaspartyl peptidase/L-asparaginase [Wenzhouxiangella sp.]|jgi:beta-aspartyl-peptidase (threonine type)|nr:isoaspartyl peptidase/L-asparaginase [Wenzhouxiangella sp.]